MTGPVLLAVAHGSRDPAAQECVRALVARVGDAVPGASVRVAFMSHAEPSFTDALPEVIGEVGPDRVVVVPLLLSTGYHLNVDVGEATRPVGVVTAGPLGPSPELVPALADRLAEAGVPAGAPVVLAAAGSSDPRAAQDAARQAELLAELRGGPVLAGFASAARPAVGDAVASLRERTGQPTAVATYLLAPGLFHTQLSQAGAAWVSAPLGTHPAVAGVIAGRFTEAAKRLPGRSAA